VSDWPLVSIIIINYNGKNYLADCLKSLLKTNYPQLEIIVVDNNSTDGSVEYLLDLGFRYQAPGSSKSKVRNQKSKNRNLKPETRNLILIRNNQNLGFAKANNQAVKIAKGEKLVFLNSDTLVEKNWLKNLVKFSLKKKKILVQPKILRWPQKNIIDNVGGIYRFPGFGLGRGREQIDRGQFDQPTQADYVNGTCFLIDKKFFNQLGGFDETYFLHYEDVDLCLRAKKQNGQCWVYPQSIIYHRGSLTIKSQIKQKDLKFHIRLNQLKTIGNNFSGIEKIIRLTTSCLLSFFSSHPKQNLRTIKELINHQAKSFLIRKD